MTGPTRRQDVALRLIHFSIEKHGMPPTLREIGDAMGIKSTNGVNDHLNSLEGKGYLDRSDRRKARGMRLTPKALGYLGVQARTGADTRGDLLERVYVRAERFIRSEQDDVEQALEDLRIAVEVVRIHDERARAS